MAKFLRESGDNFKGKRGERFSNDCSKASEEQQDQELDNRSGFLDE
jgi:hypothetical protein